MFTEHLEFIPERDAELFAAAPAAPAVFLLRGEDPQSEPYVSKTTNLRRRLQRLLAPPTEHSKKLNLRALVRTVAYTPTGSDFAPVRISFHRAAWAATFSGAVPP